MRSLWIALVLSGLALACDDVSSLVAVAIVGGAGLAVRIHAEERQLTEALGPEYEHFAAGRKRLVPEVFESQVPAPALASLLRESLR